MAEVEHSGSLRLEQQFTAHTRNTFMMSLSVPPYSFPLTNIRHKLLKRYSYQHDERIPHPHIRHKSSRDVDHEQQGPLLARPGAAQKLMTADWRVL